MGRKSARKYTDEFKQQMVSLYNNGKPSGEIIKGIRFNPFYISRMGKKVQ
jgi:hypothetical protein